MTEKPLSKRQQNILQFTRGYMDEHGRPPTIREIGKAVGINSTSVVNYNLGKLEEKGYLDRDPDVSRGLRLTDQDSSVSPLSAISLPASRSPQATTPSVPMTKKTPLNSVGPCSRKSPMACLPFACVGTR